MQQIPVPFTTDTLDARAVLLYTYEYLHVNALPSLAVCSIFCCL